MGCKNGTMELSKITKEFALFQTNQLNEKQNQAVQTVNGAVLVVAGAGSGKTRALTERIKNLVTNHQIAPHNILAITFTNKATNEMRERLSQIDQNQTIQISTFHALCAKILRQYIHNFEGYSRYFTIYNEDEKNKVLKQIMAELGVEADMFKDIAWHISNAKNLGLNPSGYKQEFALVRILPEVVKVFEAYEAKLSQNNALDFDDLLTKTYELLTNYKPVLHELQERYQYIHVDEFQDTNLVQYKIIRLLAMAKRNIFVVGDEDQCIYGWRGASVENTNLYVSDFNPLVIKLEQNYRSTKQVLEHANKLILNNKVRIDKTLWTENEEGEQVKYYKAFSDQDEAEYVVKSIHSHMQNGIPASEIAILFRMGALSRLFEERLLNYNIPYSLYGAFKFYERVEIRNILSYLWLLYNPNDNESVKRIMNYPKRTIGKTSMEKVEEVATQHGISMYDVILNSENHALGATLTSKLKLFAAQLMELKEFAAKTPSMSEVFKFLLVTMQIREQYNKKVEEDNDRLLNIGQLEQSVLTFEQNNPESELIDYLQSVTLESQAEEADSSISTVKVSTVHAVKGLEFTVVYIVGAEEGLFPISRAKDTEREMEEERRLMYVAVTRSKRHLTISSADSRYLYNARNSMMPSRFLKEMGLTKYAPTSSYTNKGGYTNFKNASFENYRNHSGSNETSSVTQSLHNYANPTPQIGSNLQSVMATKLKKQENNFAAFAPGVQVLHPKFGVGEILKNNTNEGNNSVEVKFSGYGVKNLNLDYAPLQILKPKEH